MKKAIITPTYVEHFKYIKKYLRSYDLYVKDKNKIDLVFIIEKNDKYKFENIIGLYKERCNIKILIFDELLKFYNISLSTKQILCKYKKYSYQTLKKFLAMYYLNYEQMLVLDSESMFVEETYMDTLFEQFFNTPYIAVSKIDDMIELDFFKKAVIFNYNLVLNKNLNIWFLETFAWFYDKKILMKMFQEYGAPFEIITTIHDKTKDHYMEAGCFEICLYQAYIYLNYQRFKYRVIDTYELLKENLNDKQFKSYNKNYYSKFAGNTGFIEHAMFIVDKDNFEKVGNIFYENNFNIIRCEKTYIDNYDIQKSFFKIAKPNILAASQRHTFGINNNIKNKLYLFIYLNNIFIKTVYHRVGIVTKPIVNTFRWGKAILGVIRYTIYWIFSVIKALEKL